jgi:hypothetical protein
MSRAEQAQARARRDCRGVPGASRDTR